MAPQSLGRNVALHLSICGERVRIRAAQFHSCGRRVGSAPNRPKATPLRLPEAKGKLPGVVFVPIRARFVPILQILKSRPLNGCSRHPATVSTGEKSTGARRSEVGLLATFVRDGGRLDGQTGYALYGSGPGRDPSPKIKKLIFGAPQVRIRTVCACGVAIGPSKSVLRKPGATKAPAWLPRADGTHSESASTVLWTRRTLGVPRFLWTPGA